MSGEPEVPIETLTATFIKIRDARSVLSSEFKTKDSKLLQQADKIKGALLDYCKANNMKGFKTNSGTASVTVKKKYWTSDWESFGDFVMKHKAPELFAKSLNQSNVATFLEEHPDIIPAGLNVDAEYAITIKKPTVRR